MKLEEERHIGEEYKGPPLLESEIVAAIRVMKNQKAVGADEIPAEFWKLLGDKAQKYICNLCKNIHV